MLFRPGFVGRVGRGAAPSDGSYTSEAQEFFARMTTQPDDTRKGHINTFIQALKTGNLWNKFDVLYLLAAHGETEAKLNLMSSDYNLTASATPPTFTTDRGFTGVPASSTLLTATSYNPSTGSGLKFALNDASMGIWTRTPASYDGATSRMDAYMGASWLQRRATSSASQYTHRINDGTNGHVILSGGTGDQVGHFTACRTAAAARELFRNGASINTSTTASTTVSNQLNLLGGGGSFSDAQLSAAYAGKALTGPELVTLHSALNTYLTAVGAV